MRAPRRIVASAAMVAGMVCVGSGAIAAPESDEDFGAQAQDSSFGVEATKFTLTMDDGTYFVSPTSRSNVEQIYEASEVICALRQAAAEDGEVINEETDLCEPDEDGPTLAEISAMVTTEFQTLNLAAPPITYQPEGDWALINMDFIVFTAADQQALDTTILGAPITIRATPVSYSWDFGDGSTPLSTSDQGAPYPNQTLAHVYSSASEGVVVSLTTSWQGEWQINGSGAWLPIAGFATTTTSTGAIEIVEMDVNLVPNS